MKLTIIVPSITTGDQLRYVFKQLQEQNNQDFEIIFAITKASKKMHPLIQEISGFFGSRLKIIFNTKRKSIQSDVINAFRLVKNNYVYVLNSDAEIKENFVKKITSKLDENQPDILEFRPNLKGSIKWKPNPRIKSDELFKIKTNPEYVAYSFPFLFNKVFKKSLIDNFTKYRSKEINDSKFGIELLYILLINSTSYLYWNESMCKEFISSEIWFSPSNFISQFRAVETYLESHNIYLKHELDYAQIYFLHIVLAGFINTWDFGVFKIFTYLLKSKNIFSETRAQKFLADLHKYLSKIHTENRQFFNSNIYINKPTKEAEYLRWLPELKKFEPVYKSL
ncbi:Glycosyl transferase family 2 [Mycoplasmopsis bovigenitalium]|uniref:Glycosyl transferase family 2 n=1 Tax=Mycoplasmopsis bovigenitalium TaxID=2112 RepID=A0A449A8Q7_9BACT|nr:glycosyltransferase [Mycoplasmopsis bovigenitalium]VEU60645.1 Glycosyl transferase family 2 [Mycoplasmopsis bovigenitalium]